MIVEWPAALVPRNIVIRPPRKTAGLSTSLSQFTQSVPVIRPPFGVTLEFDTLVGDDVLTYRAFLAMLEGRTNVARVPLFDPWHLPAAVPINDLVGVTVTGVQGQRNITADFGAYGPLLKAGLFIGLGDEPYVATTVSWVGSVATIRVSPTLRRSYTAQALRMKPDMIGRLPDDETGQLSLKNMRHGAPTLDFNEDFDEPLS